MMAYICMYVLLKEKSKYCTHKYILSVPVKTHYHRWQGSCSWCVLWQLCVLLLGDDIGSNKRLLLFPLSHYPGPNGYLPFWINCRHNRWSELHRTSFRLPKWHSFYLAKQRFWDIDKQMNSFTLKKETEDISRCWLIMYLLPPPPSPAPAAGSHVAPGRGNQRCARADGRPHSWPGEAQADPAAAGPAAPCTQVPATRAGQRGGEGLFPPSLPHHEERPQPHDPLPGRQVLPGWVSQPHTAFLILTHPAPIPTLLPHRVGCQEHFQISKKLWIWSNACISILLLGS